MTAFDKECPRCNGKGLPAAPPAPAPQQPVPQWPSQTPQAPHQQPAYPPPNLPGALPSVAPAANLIPFIMSGLAYCAGYFVPWASLGFLGLNININGGTGPELGVLAAAIAAMVVAFLGNNDPDNDTLSWLQIVLCTGCVAFAAFNCAQFAFFTYMLQFGFGLVLMLLAGLAMVYFSLTHAPQIMTKALSLAVACVLLSGGVGGYRGWKAKQDSLSNLQNIFGGGGAAGNPFGGATNPFGGAANPFGGGASTPRTDVDVRLNAVAETSILQPTTGLWGERKPDTGKVFLICNVTVNYTGQSGELHVHASNLRLAANNKQLYNAYDFMEDVKQVNKLSATLLPGGSATGDVVFEVNAGAKAEKVEFTGGGF